MIKEFVYSFLPIFVAMDVGGMIPVYLTLTRDLSPSEKRTVSWQAMVTAFMISVVFVVAGQFIFTVLGITPADFKIAGGILLLVLAIFEMTREKPRVAGAGAQVGVVPLGIPLIIGPAVLTSLLILISLRGYGMTLASLMANLLLVGLAFHFSERLVKVIGQNGLRALSQVISLFLAAIAVNMIRRGIESLR